MYSKDCCWSWSSNNSATWCKELTHWKRPWCWEILRAGGEGGDRERDGWMASPTQWTWVWASSKKQWRTGKPGALQSTGWQRVGHNSATEPQTLCAKLRHHGNRNRQSPCPPGTCTAVEEKTSNKRPQREELELPDRLSDRWEGKGKMSGIWSHRTKALTPAASWECDLLRVKQQKTGKKDRHLLLSSPVGSVTGLHFISKCSWKWLKSLNRVMTKQNCTFKWFRNAVFRTDQKGQQQMDWDATAVMQEKVMNPDSRLAELS